MKHVLSSNEIDFDVVVSEATPVKTLGDAKSFKIALTNLLNMAAL